MLLRLANFINKVVGMRNLPIGVDSHQLGKPSVVMKLDIEGSEVEVLEDLIMQGSLQHIDVIMVEYHTWMAKTKERKEASTLVQDIMTKIGKLSDIMEKEGENVHDLEVLPLDDESYYLSNMSLPVC